MSDETLWYRCRDFVTEQSCGEWSDKDIADDTDKLVKFVMAEIERLRAALFKARDYIAAEQTLDRPKAATLEIIDRALDGEK